LVTAEIILSEISYLPGRESNSPLIRKKKEERKERKIKRGNRVGREHKKGLSTGTRCRCDGKVIHVIMEIQAKKYRRYIMDKPQMGGIM
jgi:hypothetical protein